MFVVFDVQRAQVELDVYAAAGEAVQERADGAGAGAGSAGQGGPGTAFPRMDFDGVVVDDLDEVHIGLAREGFIRFKFRAQFMEIDGIDILDVSHGVGDAHEQAGDLIGLAVDVDGFVDDRTRRAFHGNLGAVGKGFAHVDRDQADFAVVADSDFRFHDARQGFDSKFFLVDDAVVVDVFGKAADAVAAHFRFTAVGIDDAHADVGFIARHDDDDAVGTDARMRGAHLNGQLGKILVSAVLIFQKDEVIA